MSRAKVLLIVITALTVIAIGCGKASNTNTTKAGNSNTAAAPEVEARKTLPASKVVPVPANWITMIDEQKGYAFQVPEGTERQSETFDGVDVFTAQTPEPSAVSIFVMAFKDKTLSKDDLLKFATAFLEGLDEKNVKVGDLVELSPDYSLGTITSVDAKGKVTKGKVLVATDVTDNYVMLLGTDESQFKENEKIIDEVWGSFSMRSGGASGGS